MCDVGRTISMDSYMKDMKPEVRNEGAILKVNEVGWTVMTG